MKIPEYMMEMLRGRLDLESDDTSKDEEIRKLSPRMIVRECVAWELGDPSWATRIAGFMLNAGAKPQDF
jgi:hypothetical protein